MRRRPTGIIDSTTVAGGAAVLLAAVLLAALLLGIVAVGGPASAQTSKRTPSGILAPVGTRPGEVADTIPRAWHPDCAQRARRPVSLVLGVDTHRDYKPAHDFDGAQAKALIGSLCEDDRVVLVEVGKEARLLGEPTTIADLSDTDDLILRLEERRPPRTWRRSNDSLLKVAVAEWGRRVNLDRPDLLRVLVFFTRDLESKASKDAALPDFSWASPPYWLQEHALVSVFRPITSEETVEAWEVFLAAMPPGLEREAVAQGLRVDVSAWLTPARIVPEAARPERRNKQKIHVDVPEMPDVKLVPPDLPVLWPEPAGILRWDDAWTPWSLAGGLALVLVLVLVWALFRAAPARMSSPQGAVPRVTLVVHDRLHERVVSQEVLDLAGPLRVGASMASDVTVAGPYAIEIIPGPNGTSPRVRSTNSLPVEVQRAAGGRMLRATETVPIPLRSADRIRLGGGQELEVRFS